jgi:hypothetical protein
MCNQEKLNEYCKGSLCEIFSKKAKKHELEYEELRPWSNAIVVLIIFTLLSFGYFEYRYVPSVIYLNDKKITTVKDTTVKNTNDTSISKLQTLIHNTIVSDTTHIKTTVNSTNDIKVNFRKNIDNYIQKNSFNYSHIYIKLFLIFICEFGIIGILIAAFVYNIRKQKVAKILAEDYDYKACVAYAICADSSICNSGNNNSNNQLQNSNNGQETPVNSRDGNINKVLSILLEQIKTNPTRNLDIYLNLVSSHEQLYDQTDEDDYAALERIINKEEKFKKLFDKYTGKPIIDKKVSYEVNINKEKKDNPIPHVDTK